MSIISTGEQRRTPERHHAKPRRGGPDGWPSLICTRCGCLVADRRLHKPWWKRWGK